MSIATPPLALAHVSLAEWDEDYSQREDAYELVDGIPTVAPNEALHNVDATARLIALFDPVIRPDWMPLPHFAVDLGRSQGGHTVRQPDLAVVRRGVDPTHHRVTPSDIALVVEVISPGSVETDAITKRAEYARAGIPAYLLVDVRGPRPTVVLFDRIVDGAYATPDTDGTAATIRIGDHTIPLRATDLVDE
ncbi:Uma2 family endonuclease [Agilicoccus flavus]|uniref:Uma2 family endonuclease n=1 Tax=Agilicoccus flavus TaxID=2775968 RepID=UPI001CF67D02|nr:Uma2 family endonuclease [Agilicoccus flavus]